MLPQKPPPIDLCDLSSHQGFASGAAFALVRELFDGLTQGGGVQPVLYGSRALVLGAAWRDDSKVDSLPSRAASIMMRFGEAKLGTRPLNGLMDAI